VLPAAAASLDAKVVGELLEPGGWAPTRNDSAIGLTMYEKELASVALTAFMGVRDIPPDVDIKRLWAVIIDVDSHERIGDQLEESAVIGRTGGGVDSYQVLKPPAFMPGAQRYWLVHSEIEHDVDGLVGHHRRCWSNLPPDGASETRGKLAVQYPQASVISLTHGCWEVVPAVDGAPARLRYRTVSDPGGALARTAVGMLTTRTLPQNMANFIEGARR